MNTKQVLRDAAGFAVEKVITKYTG